MRGIEKLISMVIIMIFLCSNFVYSDSLRVPIDKSRYEELNKIAHALSLVSSDDFLEEGPIYQHFAPDRDYTQEWGWSTERRLLYLFKDYESCLGEKGKRLLGSLEDFKEEDGVPFSSEELDLESLQGLTLIQIVRHLAEEDLDKLKTEDETFGIFDVRDDSSGFFISWMDWIQGARYDDDTLTMLNNSFNTHAWCENQCFFCYGDPQEDIAFIPFPIYIKKAYMWSENISGGKIDLYDITDSFAYRDETIGATVATVVELLLDLLPKESYLHVSTAGWRIDDNFADVGSKDIVEMIRNEEIRKRVRIGLSIHFFMGNDFLHALETNDHGRISRHIEALKERWYLVLGRFKELLEDEEFNGSVAVRRLLDGTKKDTDFPESLKWLNDLQFEEITKILRELNFKERLIDVLAEEACAKGTSSINWGNKRPQRTIDMLSGKKFTIPMIASETGAKIKSCDSNRCPL